MTLGTAELCADLLVAAEARVAAGEDARAIARAMAREVEAANGRMPDFGHPVHKPLDPCAERILELADQRHAAGPHVSLARLFREAVAEVWGKPLTMNVSMPIAAVLLDLGFQAKLVKSIPILARTASLQALLTDAAAARIKLGLGSMAAQNSGAVAITGGSVDGLTLDGGTF